MILLLALWEAATQPTNFLFHQPHYKPHKKGGRKKILSPNFCKFAQFYSLFASTSLQPKPSCLSPPTATSSVCSSSSTSPGRSVQLSSAQVQLPNIETERWENNSGTSIHQLEISRELRAASTFSTHSFSDSTSPDVQSSFALHSCLSWEQGSAPHDLEAQLAESEEEQEEQEERQTEEQGAVVQVERHEERAFRQQDAQNHLPRDKKDDINLKPIHLSSSSVPRSSSRTSLLVISTSRSRTFLDLVFSKLNQCAIPDHLWSAVSPGLKGRLLSTQAPQP